MVCFTIYFSAMVSYAIYYNDRLLLWWYEVLYNIFYWYVMLYYIWYVMLQCKWYGVLCYSGMVCYVIVVLCYFIL